jgi:hypothetical protein
MEQRKAVNGMRCCGLAETQSFLQRFAAAGFAAFLLVMVSLAGAAAN